MIMHPPALPPDPHPRPHRVETLPNAVSTTWLRRQQLSLRHCCSHGQRSSSRCRRLSRGGVFEHFLDGAVEYACDLKGERE